MTANAYEIPIQPGTAQKFSVQLSGVGYNFHLYWNDPAQNWVLDISDVDGNPIAFGIALVTGSNLLEQYNYLGFVGALIVQSDNDYDLVPNFTSLGDTGHLYYVTP